MPYKVAILNQGYIPHYRLRFFELLQQRGENEYVVYHGEPPSWTGVPRIEGPFGFTERWVKNREIRIGPWTAVYQPVLREIIRHGFDAVVIGQDLKFLSSVLLAVLAKCRGISVVYWDFGYHPRRGFSHGAHASGLALRTAVLIKKLLAKLSDGYLAYTQAGADKLIAQGYPPERIFVLRNTLDMSEQLALHAAVEGEYPAAIRRRFGLAERSTVFVYLGRLVEFKRVDWLIEAVRRLNSGGGEPEVEALVIGSGPLEQALRQQAEGVPGVHFLGALPPGEEVARCLKIAAAAVIPGAVGLAVNHAFAHGCPMITGDHELHGPEIEYLRDGENGLIVPSGAAELAMALRQMALAPELQARLADGALRSRTAFRLEEMVDQFEEGVRSTLTRNSTRRARAASGVSGAGAFISSFLL